MTESGANDVAIQSIERCMHIVEIIRGLNGATVSEIADETDMAKGTVHGYLSTLQTIGYLIIEEDTYQVGTKFLRLGEYSRTYRDEYTLTAETVEELAETTGERSQFVVEEHGKGVFLYRGFGDRAVETESETGKRMYLHATSAGKAILSQFPEEDVHRIIKTWGLQEVTPKSITDREELFSELETIRDRGYAVNKEEHTNALNAVGVPVTGKNQETLGALSVSGPTYRMTDNRITEIAELLLGMANELELKIVHSE